MQVTYFSYWKGFNSWNFNGFDSTRDCYYDYWILTRKHPTF